MKATKATKRQPSAQVVDDSIVEEGEYVPKVQPAVTRKKSTFNRLTEMITKSPILEPLRSENFFILSFIYSHPIFCISLPFSLFVLTGFKFYQSILNNKDRPTRQSKLKSSSSNASDKIVAGGGNNALKVINADLNSYEAAANEVAAAANAKLSKALKAKQQV